MLKRQSQLVAIGFAAAALFAATSFTALAQKKYGPGVTDTEIKIGNIMPYSGPAAAYFNKVNAEGGINGRKINFISYDDGYSPPSRRASSSRATKFCSSSTRSARRPIRQSKNI